MIKVSKEIIEKKNKVKKEHLIRFILWTVGIALNVIWLAMVLATSISMGEYKIYGEAIEIKNQEHFETLVINGFTPFLEEGRVVMKQLIEIKDWNPLCLTYDNTLMGWYICILLAPIGYMGIIYIIAYMKNIITPGAIIRTVRRALQFGYLKQKDVDYIVEEVNYNAGLKERQKNEEEQQEEKLNN